jgi:hypothetical protein
MSRSHAIVFAALLAVNAVIGTVALTRTIHLGQASQTASRNATATLVAKRTAQLDRFEASLKTQLAKKPPPLPKVPSAATYASSAPSVTPVASTPQVRYVRPAPIIVHKHRPGGELEAEGADHGEGGDD